MVACLGAPFKSAVQRVPNSGTRVAVFHDCSGIESDRLFLGSPTGRGVLLPVTEDWSVGGLEWVRDHQEVPAAFLNESTNGLVVHDAAGTNYRRQEARLKVRGQRSEIRGQRSEVSHVAQVLLIADF